MCNAGVCTTEALPAGSDATQTPGNCQHEQCDGEGSVGSVPDDADQPDDGNVCTEDLCIAGTPSNPPLSAGEPCGQGLVCDGDGACVGCVSASDCGTDTACQTFGCDDGTCVTTDVAAGTPVPSQTEGDCREVQCNGFGAEQDVEDNADVPVDDNPCTEDLCAMGVPSNPAEPVGTTCGAGGEQCDGTGQCVGCLGPADCPGQDTECQTRTCTNNVCGFSFTAAGFVVASQSPGDCQESQCDGSGGIVDVIDDTDLPDDSNACTNDVCTSGVASNPDLPSGTSCGVSLLCDGNGQCVGCLAPSDCPGQDDECQTRTCVAGMCGLSFAAAGTVTSQQQVGDCQQSQCDGSGNVVSVALDVDVPADDNNQCTSETCSAGSPQHPPLPTGTACSQNGGSFCDASAQCVECNVPANCPGQNGECESRTCVANSCGVAFAPPGTVTSNQAPGDCRQNQCDGAGGIVNVAFNSDLPTDDGNACTSEVCNAGVPGHPAVVNGSSCNDGSLCTQLDTCQAGTCVGADPVTCSPLDACHVAGTCDPSTGTCSSPSAPDGTTCDDGSLCTQADSCVSGTCTGSNPVVCTASSPCHVAGTCDPSTGACSDPVAPDGTSCNDGDLCTQVDVCQAGSCTGTTPVMCGPSDACHLSGTCDPGTGTCDSPIGNEGGACDDGDLCTQNDACASGTCLGGTPIVCTPLDQCHVAGVCVSATGACTNPSAPDGTACTIASVTGACVSGVCQLPPQVSSVTPGNGAALVQTTTSIAITFSAAMDPATLTVKSTLDSGACSGSIQVSTDDFATCVRLGNPVMSGSNTVATVTPSPALSYGSTYRVRVTTAAQSQGGQAIAPEFTQTNGWTTRLDTAPVDDSVVISQIYPSGGASGALYANDFVELHNRGTTTVSLSPWALHFASGSGTVWQKVNVSGSIPPGGYLLVQLGSAGGGLPLPSPEVTDTSVDLDPANGKVVLTNNSGSVSGVCPSGASIVDIVGYGAGTTCSELSPAAAPAMNQGLARLLLGYTDTDDNAADLFPFPPIPRNNVSTPQRFVVNESNLSSEADYCVVQFPATLDAQAGTSAGPVYCQVYEAGETEAAGPAGTFTVEVGYGPITANPQSQSGWTWVAAPFNVQSGNNDEYAASFTAPPAGSHRYACRVVRANATTYCDVDGAGSNVGLFFETPREGVLTSTP